MQCPPAPEHTLFSDAAGPQCLELKPLSLKQPPVSSLALVTVPLEWGVLAFSHQKPSIRADPPLSRLAERGFLAAVTQSAGAGGREAQGLLDVPIRESLRLP